MMIASYDVVVATLETANALENSRKTIFIEALSSTTLRWQAFVPLENRNFG